VSDHPSPKYLTLIGGTPFTSCDVSVTLGSASSFLSRTAAVDKDVQFVGRWSKVALQLQLDSKTKLSLSVIIVWEAA
jgi:hypothetical protein